MAAFLFELADMIYKYIYCSGTNLLNSFLLAVVEECAKQAAIQVVQDGDEEQLVELERSWELNNKQKNICDQQQMPAYGTIIKTADS